MHVNPSAPPSYLLSDLKPEHLEPLKVKWYKQNVLYYFVARSSSLITIFSELCVALEYQSHLSKIGLDEHKNHIQGTSVYKLYLFLIVLNKLLM